MLLTKVQYPSYTEELFYDRAGNRIQRILDSNNEKRVSIEENYRYNPRNRLTEYTKGKDNHTFQYDNAGNLLIDNKAKYIYDVCNRTEKVETFDGHVQINRYDAEGLRSQMEEDGELVQFIFRGEEVVTEEKNGNIIRFIRGYDLISSDAESAKTYYHYASDEMGSITHVVDDARVLNRYEYDAWENPTVCEEVIENRFRFNGQQYDAITQQYYLRARFYNPVIARFTQEDTYWGAGLNLYTYCVNNPIYYVDSSGHQPKCVKEAVQKYIDEGMSKEDAYKKAYQKHAERKLADGNFSAKERYQLEYRSDRLNGNDKENSFKKNPDNKGEIHNPVVDGERVGSAKKASDGQHGFPDIVDNYAGYAVHTQIVGGDGVTRDLYQLEGGYKYYDDRVLPNQRVDVNGGTHRMDVLDTRITNTDGIFEWIIESDSSISHRRFIPNDQITDYPSQITSRGN